MGQLKVSEYDEIALAAFLEEKYLGLWHGKVDEELDTNVIIIDSVTQVELDAAVAAFDFTAASAAVADNVRVSGIKQKAKQVIYAEVPLEVQINSLRRLFELIEPALDLSGLSSSSLSEIESLRAKGLRIDAIRSSSNAAELAGTLPDQFNP
jgi:hypothetical protein